MNRNFSPFNFSPKFFFALLILSISICLLNGCEKNKPNQTNAPTVIKKYPKLTLLKGTVNYNNRPVSSGTIKAATPNGKLIASTELANSNHYQIEIPAGTELPIVLTFYPDASEKNKETLVSAAIHPNLTQYDLNPFTTAIAKKAQALGGYTHTNMTSAAESTVHVPDENKTSSGWRGDPTKQYGGWH